MAEISRGQVNYNTVAGSIGLAGAAMPVLQTLLGGWGNCNNGWNHGAVPIISECNENMPVNRYELGLIQENAALKTEVEMHKAEIYTDNKFEKYDEKYERRFRNIEGRLAEQAVFNERTSATVGCLAQQANGMQVILNSITKTVVAKDAICPEVMPRYNSWVAPTDDTTTTTTP